MRRAVAAYKGGSLREADPIDVYDVTIDIKETSMPPKSSKGDGI
jgi:hypothetical protein